MKYNHNKDQKQKKFKKFRNHNNKRFNNHKQYRTINPQKSALEELQNDNENFCNFLKDKIKKSPH